MNTTPTQLRDTLHDAGLTCEVYEGPSGLLARVLGERQNYSAADRIVREHGAMWVSDAQTPDQCAALGYPVLVASPRAPA
jgi:hypothetical protein